MDFVRAVATVKENCHQHICWGHNAQQQNGIAVTSVYTCLSRVLLNAWTVCGYEHTLALRSCLPACK